MVEGPKLTLRRKSPAKITLKNKITIKKGKSVTLKPKQSLVFIDTSYFIFYRYHATKAWYKHSGKGEDDNCHIEDEAFVDSFTKHFKQWCEKISKQFGVKQSDFFWFRDSPRETLWRTPLFEGYKANRDCPDGISGFFRYVYDNLIPGDRQIKVDRAEADDVAAVAVKLENKMNPHVDIVVLTADTDYLQLVNDKVKIVKLPKFQEIPVEVKVGKNKMKVTPREYLITKILVGDTADEIPKVYAGCGPSVALKIARDEEMFKKCIEDHPDRLEKFNHNKTLICFDQIPDDIREMAEMEYLKVRNCG